MLETSVPASDVALDIDHELITKDAPLDIVPILKAPSAAAPVAPTLIRVKIMIELEVTDVVDTVAVPPTRVTVPNELAPAAVVVPTFAERILLPDVWKFRLPVILTVPLPARMLVVDVVFDEPIVTVLADAPEAIETVLTPAAVAIFTVLPAVPTLAIETVVAPAPAPIATMFVPLDDPTVMVPV